MSKKLKIAVLMGGVSSERDISLATGENVVSALDKKKYEVFPIDVRDKVSWILDVKRKKPHLVFVGLHGEFGEDGGIQGLLDDMRILYTGSGTLASMLAMNKIITKKIFEANNIPTPRYTTVDREHHYFKKQDLVKGILSQLKLPFVIKPAASGSSVGVTIVKDKKNIKSALKSAFKEDELLLVEDYIKGTEITVPVLGNRNPKALPVIEIVPKRDFFDFKAKYDPRLCDEIVPARISKELARKAKSLALKVYKAFDCRGFARVDMMLKKSKIYVLEINTIPGLTKNSLVPKSARASGIEFPQLLDKIINYAREKKI